MSRDLSADECSVSTVCLEEANNFFNLYHESGATTLSQAVVSLGLFYKQELLAVAQFCAPRMDRERELYTAELCAVAFKSTLSVNRDLASILSYYKKVYHPSDIFAYHDIIDTHSDNLGLFVNDLDWHIDETDSKVYAWFEKNITFYTYEITASDSEKYYYGVSHIKHANATIDECLTDGYWGSGGSKFQNWKRKHSKFLVKKVISIHLTKAETYLKEKALIGEKWTTDKNCLNSLPGGKLVPNSVSVISLQTCSIHGETLHSGSTCFKCTAEKCRNMAECSIHGMTYHHGESCRKCSRAKAFTLSTCSIHGKGIFVGTQCLSCINQASVSKKNCSIHGVVTFQGENCTACSTDAKLHVDTCSIHGETKHYSGTCCKCTSAKRVSKSECTVHGEVNFLDGKCSNCATEALVSIRTCTVHGDTKHQGDQCSKCSSSKSFGIKDCAIHGETKHNGNQCCACQVEAAVGMKECLTHGLTKHQGDKCSSCSNGKLISLRICATHGETKHRGSSCYKCAGTKKAGSTMVLKDCPRHGEAKHQGNACAKCRIEKRSHNQKHKDLAVAECQFCDPE